MKKVISFFIFFSVMLASIPVFSVRGYESYWIECEKTYTSHSGAFKEVYDTNSSGSYCLKLKSEKEEPAVVDINFNISRKDIYDVYLIGLPINTDWASKTYYKFNDDGNDAYTNKYISSKSAYTDSTLSVPVSFIKLTEREFDRGANKITFYVPSIRTLSKDYMLSYLDAVIIVPKAWGWNPLDLKTKPYDLASIKLRCTGGTIPKQTAEKNGEIKVDVKYRAVKKLKGTPRLRVELVRNGESVSVAYKEPSIPLKQWGVGIDYTESFNLSVPFCVPDGVYEVVAGVDGITLETGEKGAKIGEVTIGKPEEVLFRSAVVSDWEISADVQKGRNLSFEGKVELTEGNPGNAYVSLWKDGLLYDVVISSSKPTDGKISGSGKINPDIPSGKYTARLGIFNYGTVCDEYELTVSGEETGKEKYYKPMSYGNYRSGKTGDEAFWFINQAGSCIWNGEAYIPMGGMFCSSFIVNFKPNNTAANIKNFEQDKADLEKLRSIGIKDLYLNPVTSAYNTPSYAFDYFMNYLEENGWVYGLQLGDIKDEKYMVYTPLAAREHIKVEDVTKSGPVTITAAVTAANISAEVSCTYLAVNNQTGEAVNTGKGELEIAKDGKLIYKADVKIQDGASHTVYFMPLHYTSPVREFNFWQNYEQKLETVRQYCSNLSFGNNFRLVVDPITNEMGFYNQNEGSRIYDKEFNELYCGWLEKKYGTVDKLNSAWLVNVSSFEEAARLVPIYTERNGEGVISYTYSVDGDNPSQIHKSDTHKSLLWNDYLMGRDGLYAQFNNAVADAVKETLDVPVIFKHCSVQREYLINRELEGGFDGLGTESYGTVKVTSSRAATTSAICDQFARTAWRIITETNTEENITLKYKSNEWSYPNEEHFNNHFDGMFDNGMKGGFNFLLSNRFDLSGQLGDTYATIENEKEWPWWQPYLDKHEKRKSAMAKQTYDGTKYYFYPSQKNWWWSRNERKVVQLGDDNIPIQRFFVDDTRSAYQTDDPDVNADVLFVNLQNGPYSLIFGPELEKTLSYTDRKTVYIGFRNDIGTIPSLDKYFTDKKVKLSDTETVQILSPSPTAQVLLSTPDGEPYAIKDGNIYIVATTDLFDISGEYYTFKYLDLLEG